jgi:methylase of polypeptide subunit release factors
LARACRYSCNFSDPFLKAKETAMKSAVLSRLSEPSQSHAQSHGMLFEERDLALLAIGRLLHEAGYVFTTVTPETHRRVLKRKLQPAYTELRDIFGWNRPFRMKELPQDLRQYVKAAQVARQSGALAKSTVRFSTVGRSLFVHSAYPTDQADAVFFGPDTYRFLQFVTDAVKQLPPPRRIVDIGAGSGAAAIYLSRLFPKAHVMATDINPAALRFAALNAALNGAPMIEFRESDIAANIPDDLDLIVANPPYLVDATARAYRHGGGATGGDLSLRIITECLPKLSSSGRLLLYTGTAIINGRDELLAAAEQRLHGTPWTVLDYREIDPDVFGEELDNAPYSMTDRIAVVGLTLGAKAPVSPNASAPQPETEKVSQ